MIRNISALVLVFVLAACSSTSVEDYAEFEPKLDVFDFFDGELIASGIVRNRSGELVRHFTADIKAYREGDTLVLDEQFLFNDGEVQYRRWEIIKTEDEKLVGKANDTLGQAKGRTSGNAMHWVYRMALTVDGRSFKVDFDDWMYRVSDDSLINVTDIKKWGFKVGEVILVIRKV